ncbi:MAG TPA: lipase family protein [Anaerolineales bacterium]
MAVNQSATQKSTLSTPEELQQAREYFKDNDILLTPPIMRAAYSDRMAWLLSSMSHLAYDKFEDKENPKTYELFVAKLASGGFKLIATFNSDKTDTQAFLAANGDFAVLAFRGTEVTKKKDVITDVAATQISVLEGRVHRGFRDAYESVREEIEASLSQLDNKIPLYITGHSLGAALATIATQELDSKPQFRDRIAACYTFGSPRVGNSQYDKSFKAPIYRMVNTTDIVTVIPLLAMGYIHIGDIRFLGRKQGDFRRQIPIVLRALLFVAALFRLFGPWVGDHAIVEYRRKLEAIAEKRNAVLHRQ